MFNRAFLMGNLCKDPELRYTPQGTAVCNLRLAVNHVYKSKDSQVKTEVLYITVILWAKRAENCAQYLKKGSQVFVEGRLATKSWENNGQQVSVIELQAERIQFMDRAKEGTSPEQEQEG